MKKFLRKMLPFVLLVVTLEIIIPIIADPYNVFHWKEIRDNGVEPNSNYIKMKYILDNPDKFDSFLFGSSRTGFVNVENIPEGKWYNMSYSEGLPEEHLENLQEMIEHGIVPKNVMIGVDNISAFVVPSMHEKQFYRIPYPRENKLGFYANYFSIRGVIESLDITLNHEVTDPDYVERYYQSGSSLRDPSLAGQWEIDAPYWEYYYRDYIGDSVLDMRRISNLCKEHGINLIVFTNPIYYKTFQESEYYGYMNFLDLLAYEVEYYNFSGINEITQDHKYYYEPSHYTEEVGDMIIDRIFNEKRDEALEAQGFGFYTTFDNRHELKKVLANH